jgi:hypothetical protein
MSETLDKKMEGAAEIHISIRDDDDDAAVVMNMLMYIG